MRIIKQGQLISDQLFEATCRTCGTEIEFARKEAENIFDQREGDYLQIDCPLCNSMIYKYF